MQGNFAAIEQLLKKYFRGLGYNHAASSNQQKQLNQIRLYHLQARIREACKDETCKKQVLELSQEHILVRTIRNKKVTINTISPNYRIPAHLAWDVVRARLIIAASSVDEISKFKQEYNHYTQLVVDEGEKDQILAQRKLEFGYQRISKSCQRCF